jgi:hypothetical protein
LAAKLTLHEIKTRILHHHGNSYDFDPASFLSGDKPMKFKCQKHGPFFKKPEDFCPPIGSSRIPKGCPDCGKATGSGNKKIGVQEFKQRFKATNNKNLKVDFYTYKSMSAPVAVTCLIHDFTWKIQAYEIAPPIGSKVKPKGCRKCAGRNLDWPEVLALFRERHGDFYKYFPETFVNMTSPMRIECPDPSHKTLWQAPGRHASERGGCQSCGWVKGGKKKRISKSLLLQRSEAVHGKNFDYSRVDFSSGLTEPVEIVCLTHPKRIIKINFDKHVSQKHGGCRDCHREAASERQRLSKDEFVRRAQQIHGHGTYIYDEVHEFRNLNETVQIICPRHGRLHPMTAGNHLMGRKHGRIKRDIIGQGCRKCGTEKAALEKSMSFEQFLERAMEIHDGIYSYREVEWVSRAIHIQIRCEKHGLFKQRPSDHLSGNGCSKCNKRISRKERLWLDSLDVPDDFRQTSINIDGKQMHLDAYDPITNIAYEFWGDYFHGNPNVYPDPNLMTFTGRTIGELFQRTCHKKELLKSAGIQIIEIWESEWDARAKTQKKTH